MMSKVTKSEILHYNEQCNRIESRYTWYVTNYSHSTVSDYMNNYSLLLLNDIKMLLIKLNEYVDTNKSTLTHDESNVLDKYKSTLIEMNDTINEKRKEMMNEMTISEKLSNINEIDDLSVLVDEVVNNYTDSKETNQEVEKVVTWINERLASGYYAYNQEVLENLRVNKNRLYKVKVAYGYNED